MKSERWRTGKTGRQTLRQHHGEVRILTKCRARHHALSPLKPPVEKNAHLDVQLPAKNRARSENVLCLTAEGPQEAPLPAVKVELGILADACASVHLRACVHEHNNNNKTA